MHQQHALEQAPQQHELQRALESKTRNAEERTSPGVSGRGREAAEEALRISQAKLDEATLAHEEYTHRAMVIDGAAIASKSR